MPIRRALSVKQPYAEQILLGRKKYEYRSIATRIRGRIYIYATLKPLDHTNLHLPRGQIIGTVEITGCEWSKRQNCYRWKLSRPRRIRPCIPLNHPQPVWFYPFNRKTNAIAKAQRR
jgi:hypothetical protein